MRSWSKRVESSADTISGTNPDDNSIAVTRNSDICRFWDCEEKIKTEHYLCRSHFRSNTRRTIDECQGCGRYKWARYKACPDCSADGRSTRSKVPSRTNTRTPPPNQYQREHSRAWAAGDANASVFYVYILKLDDGCFYAGQTRELRERLSEHRDGRTKSTAGRNPKLIWFAEVPTRKRAVEREVELKRAIDHDPRSIRRLTLEFRDLVSELDFS